MSCDLTRSVFRFLYAPKTLQLKLKLKVEGKTAVLPLPCASPRQFSPCFPLRNRLPIKACLTQRGWFNYTTRQLGPRKNAVRASQHPLGSIHRISWCRSFGSSSSGKSSSQLIGKDSRVFRAEGSEAAQPLASRSDGVADFAPWNTWRYTIPLPPILDSYSKQLFVQVY